MATKRAKAGFLIVIRTEENGYNAALYWYPDDGLILAVTTNVGPFESGRVTVSRALAARLEEALLGGVGAVQRQPR